MQTGKRGKSPSPPAGAQELPRRWRHWLRHKAPARPRPAGAGLLGAAGEAPPPGWERCCPDPPVPTFILEQGLAAGGPARRGQRNQSGPIARYPPAPRRQPLRQPLRAPGSGASPAACFPPKITPRRHHRLPKAGAGQTGARPVGRRVPQPTWPPFAPAPAGRTRPAAVTAGARGWHRAARLRQGRSGAGSQPRGERSLPPQPARRQLPTRGERSENAYPFGGLKKAGLRTGYARQPANLCDFKFSLPLRSNGA